MTSDDEMDAAQVVANWLRELADRYPCGVPLEKFLGSLDVGVFAGHCDYLLDSDDVGKLADLIDPTCELIDRSDISGEPMVCSCCGKMLNRNIRWHYCPSCGARVASGNE